MNTLFENSRRLDLPIYTMEIKYFRNIMTSKFKKMNPLKEIIGSLSVLEIELFFILCFQST